MKCMHINIYKHCYYHQSLFLFYYYYCFHFYDYLILFLAIVPMAVWFHWNLKNSEFLDVFWEATRR